MSWDERNKARTKALRQGFKEEVLPCLKALGFKKQYPPLAAGDCEDLWGNNWSRQRGEFTDEIHIEWRTLQRPFFMIEFWTDQTERVTLYDPRLLGKPGRFFYARIPMTHPKIGREVWYGERTSLKATINIAKERLAELDDYLRTGYTTAHIRLCSSVAVWRERPAELFPNPPVEKRHLPWWEKLLVRVFGSEEEKRRFLAG